ncbi:MAG: hypothetical protein HY758_01700 [Nitrospirae bacterium]|nr:hypothetical protein [Nitrospirota bacterium]
MKLSLKYLVCIVLIASACTACRQEKVQPPPTRTEENMVRPEQDIRPDDIPTAAWEAYKAARTKVIGGKYLEARRYLLIAVQEKPDFTEAWYNLGALNGNLAIEKMAQGQEQASLSLFREAVDQKRRAQALIAEGKWFVYKTPAEQAQVQYDIQEALSDADEVLEDEPSLIQALKLMAAFKGR